MVKAYLAVVFLNEFFFPPLHGFNKVMDFKELCQILEIPEVVPQMEPPSPTGQPADIHTFLASPSSDGKK